MMTGCLPQRWPIWLKPDLVEMDGPADRSFPGPAQVTRTAASLGTDPRPCRWACLGDRAWRGVTWFLAGDATYSQANLLPARPTASPTKRGDSRHDAALDQGVRVKKANNNFAAHDPDGPARLANRLIFA